MHFCALSPKGEGAFFSEGGDLMKYPWVDDYLLEKTAVQKDFKEEWGWFRYQIGNKLFAAVCLDEAGKPYYITMKLEPAKGDFYRQLYSDVLPGYYMNKVHWNSVRADGAVPDEVLKDMLDESYRIVLHSFSKKKQKELLGE